VLKIDIKLYISKSEEFWKLDFGQISYPRNLQLNDFALFEATPLLTELLLGLAKKPFLPNHRVIPTAPPPNI
jgi:hypothetical protein